jgi:WD40 repeat protein
VPLRSRAASDSRIVLMGVVGSILLIGIIIGGLMAWSAHKNQWDNAHREEILALKSKAETFHAQGQIKDAHATYGKLRTIIGNHQATTRDLASAIQDAKDNAAQVQIAYDQIIQQEEQQRLARIESARVVSERTRQLELAREEQFRQDQEKVRRAASRLAEIPGKVAELIGNGQLAQVPALLKEAAAIDPNSPALRQISTDMRRALLQSGSFVERMKLQGHTDWIEKIAMTEDSKKIISGSSDGTLRIWDSSTGQQVSIIKSGGWASAFGMTRNGNSAVIQVQTQRFQVWDLDQGQMIREFSRQSAPGESRVGGLWTQLSGTGKFAVTGGIGQYQKGFPVYVWEVETGRIAAAMLGHSQGVLCAAISPDGAFLATGTFDGGASDPQIGIWDVAANRSLKIFKVAHGRGEEVYTTNINGLAFTPDGQRLVSASGKTLRVWSIPDGALVSKIVLDRAEAKGVALSPDGRTAACVVMTAPDGKYVYNVAIIDLESGKLLQALDAGGTCRCVAYANDGMTIATGGTDKVMRVWSLNLQEQWKREALALCDQVDKGVGATPPIILAGAGREERWAMQANSGTAAQDDKQRELQYQANVQAQLERSRADEKARFDALQNQPDQPRGIANLICQNLKDRGMIESATFINYFESGGTRQWDNLPEKVDDLCVRYRFTFTTQAGLLRVYNGYVALSRRSGKWQPIVVNVDGINDVPAGQFLRK